MEKDSGLKGISPLVAVIMLIAFTMVVAGILASWASQFALTQRQQIQLCSEAFIFIQSGVYDNSSTPPELNLMVWNNGDVDLTGFDIIVTYDNDSLPNKYSKNVNITAGDIKILTVAGAPINIKSVDVVSNECKGARDMLLKYNIKGLT